MTREIGKLNADSEPTLSSRTAKANQGRGEGEEASGGKIEQITSKLGRG